MPLHPSRQAPQAGQFRSFRIVKLDPAAKKIEVEILDWICRRT